MAEHASNEPVELGATMDYAEHRSTYHRFLAITKYGTLAIVAILLAMAFGFFGGGGFISSGILFVLVLAVGAYAMR